MKNTMKKYIRIVLSAVLCLSLVLPGFVTTAQAVNALPGEKVTSNVTVDQNFADNRVLVVLTREASMTFTTYTADSFASLGCVSITDLSDATGAMAKAAMEQAMETFSSRGISDLPSTPVEHSETISNYRQVLCLELNEASKENVIETIKLLSERDDVLYAGPDYVVTLRGNDNENDIEVASDGISDADKRWAADRINAFDAQALITDPAPVLVGVIDTGIDGTHPAFFDCLNISLCRDFSSGNEVVTGIPVDVQGHGTAVASVIAGGDDMYGIAPNATLVSLRVLVDFECYSSRVAMAINYATRCGIDILNISLGWNTSYSDYDQYYDYALESIIRNYPGLCVCAAGNDGYNLDTMTDYPSSYELNNIISVGASNKNDERWIGNIMSSSYGRNTVGIFAPGVDIYVAVAGWSIYGGDMYELNKGTSFAAPLVTGVAALMLSANPYLQPFQLQGAILDAADPVAALIDLCAVDGRLNAYNAMLEIIN